MLSVFGVGMAFVRQARMLAPPFKGITLTIDNTHDLLAALSAIAQKQKPISSVRLRSRASSRQSPGNSEPR
jgi:hypothetical protein